MVHRDPVADGDVGARVGGTDLPQVSAEAA